MTRAVLLALLLAAPYAAAAQGTTGELLDRAAQHHAALDVEREITILRQIVSPNSPFIVTHEQRVLAYKYLGAALVVRGQADSGILYFRAAIERDPLVDLEPQTFTPRERQAFAQARRLTFALGGRAVAVDTIDPRTERLSFTVLSTHTAALRVELRSAGTPSGLPLYAGDNDGPRELQWDGLLADGRLAPPGRYELFVAGQSQLNQRADSVRLYFSVAHEHAPLEDTLPALRPDELLAEQHPAGRERQELLRGFGLAAGVLLMPRVLANGELHGGGRRLAGGIAGAASLAGLAGFVYRRRHREIPGNIAANAQNRAARAAANAAILERNRARLAETRVVVAPAAGVGP
ncbi:MAG TPA: hypothetical protein VGQ06_12275 [Gemmatimonadales bacterium]|jgi:hypothetical protein|nr:hypothetical protein [Gemmatimonadales bacterium]